MTLNRRCTDFSHERTGSRSRSTLITENRSGRAGKAAVSVVDAPRGSAVSLAPATGRVRRYVWHRKTAGRKPTLVQSNTGNPLQSATALKPQIHRQKPPKMAGVPGGLRR